MKNQRIYKNGETAYYLDSTSQAWLIAAPGVRSIQTVALIPADALMLTAESGELPQYEEAVNAIEHLNYLEATR